MTLDTSIEFLKNIGTERAKLIKNVLGIATVEDFLNFFPIRYIDKSKTYLVKEVTDLSLEIQLKGKISNLQEISFAKGKKRLSATFTDASGTVDLVWFQYSNWLKEQIPLQLEVFIFGKVSVFNAQLSMAHPEIELVEKKAETSTLLPVYPSSEKLTKRGLHQKFFQTVLRNILQNSSTLILENLPLPLLNSMKLMNRVEAFQNIHFPLNTTYFENANKRLKFEEAFYFQLSYGFKKRNHLKNAKGNPFPLIGDHFNDFYNHHLPFELTNAQKKVLKEIRQDLKKPIQMNRLLQGDVGSGKTMVALLTMLIAKDNGFQSCLMAPTEILAQQHFVTLKEALKNTSICIELLTGSTKTKDRKSIFERLLNGDISILVGTHALLEDNVQFNNLGYAIIDEQHRFGVAQRAKLWSKNKIPPHILVMTATPIPRTLAMSFYSDLEISVIDELPIGRKPIITAHRREQDRLSVFQFAKDEIKKGRQIYFVYPLIEESETLVYKNLMEGFERVSEFFPLPEFHVSVLHGKMKSNEKEEAMNFFASGKSQIMVATTVIEVGVNVPNASVMIIESAERFGLSQLHQLRGRVGRGAEQSYCILMSSDKISNEGRKRIKTMCETNDGFVISEVDLQLRGPGDILGTQQSGSLEFKKLDLLNDSAIIKTAKIVVEELLQKDEYLNLPENQSLRNYYLLNYKSKQNWSKIS